MHNLCYYSFLNVNRITSVVRRKGVARDWFGNGIPVSVMGKIEFFQQTEYGITDVELSLEGLKDIRNYHIHMVRLQFLLNHNSY